MVLCASVASWVVKIDNQAAVLCAAACRFRMLIVASTVSVIVIVVIYLHIC
jgi:hypothetical protein